jgi:hypothetical protein
MSAVKRIDAANKKWWCLFFGEFNPSNIIKCDKCKKKPKKLKEML